MNIALAVVLGLASMLGYSFANVYSQPLARRLGSQQSLFLRGVIVCLILGIAAIPSFHYLGHGWYVLLALLIGIVGYIPLLSFTHALKVSRVGIVAPIAGTSALITVLLAFFVFHTPLHIIQWMAVGVIVLANVGASINLRDFRSSKLLQLISGVPFALVAALGWGVFFFILVYPTRALGPWLTAFLTELGVTMAAGVHLMFSHKRVKLRSLSSSLVIFNALFIITATLAYTIGIRKYNLGIMGVLANSPALPSVLLAGYLFKEKLTLTEKWAAALMVIGVMGISIT